MTITINAYENSHSISTTEYSLPQNANYSSGSPVTADGVFQLILDLSALAAGDQFELKRYEASSSGGAQKLIGIPRIFDGAQGVPSQQLDLGTLGHGWDVTLVKNAGSDRTILWSIRQIA